MMSSMRAMPSSSVIPCSCTLSAAWAISRAPADVSSDATSAAQTSGAIISLTSDGAAQAALNFEVAPSFVLVVRESDSFRLRALDQLPIHDHDPFLKDRGAIVGVYVVVKTADGDYLTHPMTIDEVYDIRDRSESWKSFMQKKAKNSPLDTVI